MAAKLLTRADVRRLATRLDQPGAVPDDVDRAVLRAVLELAAAALSEQWPPTRSDIPIDSIRARPLAPESEQEGDVDPPAHAPGYPRSGGSLPPLLAGFEGAFQPGGAARFATEQKPSAEEAAKRPVITARLV